MSDTPPVLGDLPDCRALTGNKYVSVFGPVKWTACPASKHRNESTYGVIVNHWKIGQRRILKSESPVPVRECPSSCRVDVVKIASTLYTSITRPKAVHSREVVKLNKTCRLGCCFFADGVRNKMAPNRNLHG